jgi:hypothetical protein
VPLYSNSGASLDFDAGFFSRPGGIPDGQLPLSGKTAPSFFKSFARAARPDRVF